MSYQPSPPVCSWSYNIRTNANSGLTMRRVAITFFELGVVKKFS